jgi:hypothetical protein
MSRSKILFAVLIATLAASACASAVASAELPELVSSSFPIKYSGTIAESAKWEVPGGSSFICTGSTSTSEGEITGPKTITAVMHFRGCKAGGAWCTSEGAKTGEIVTQPLVGTVVYPPNFNKNFAAVFKPKSGVNIVNLFTCIVNAEVRGSIIAISPTQRNKPTSTLEFTFSQAGGAQNPLWYYTEAGEKIHASLETSWLDTGSFQALGWGFNSTLNLSGGTVEPKFV